MKLEDAAILHRYNRMVRLGEAEPLTHRCGDTYTVGITGEELVLKCAPCGAVVHPGQGVVDRLKLITEDYFASDNKD